MTESTKQNQDGQEPEEARENDATGTPEAETAEAESGAAEEREAAAPKSPEQEAADLKDRLLRAVAETENVRRRAEREREETAKYAVTGFARDLLNVADNLRRALQNLSPEVRAKDEAVNTLADGVELTERELLRVFDKYGIRVLDPQPGEKFDHNFHQAMFEVPNADQAPGTIVTVMQVGYALKDRLLRPAMVGVAKAAPGGEPEQKVDTTV
ncbi:MAG TPA: nucleotide exchange factor GrpE [Alphaproteobacteria bacterium]|nr:nucleotide exchange factor GrpE [Alphaproteobacteria bacterium]